MTNLVIGSEGFVGRPLCNYLKGLGEIVERVDIKLGIDARNFKFNLDNIDRVYFLAWDVGGAKYLYEQSTQLHQMQWNMELLSNVMPQISHIPYVFISSQLAVECDTVYGVQKRLGEVWTSLSKSGFSVRLWNVYGAAEPTTIRSHVISDFIYQAVTTGAINMMTNGDELRQFIHVNDLCSAIHLGFNDKLRGVYDVSSCAWVSIIDVARIIGNITGAVINPGCASGKTVYINNIEVVPGWKANVGLVDGIEALVKQYRMVYGSVEN